MTLAAAKIQNENADNIIEWLDCARQAPRFAPYAPELLKFAADVSHGLLNDPALRKYPEIQVLGFWLRPAALDAMKKEFTVKAGCIAVPQGVVFHIPPANVDTMFAYSLFTSLLCGNANIVRLPSRRGAVADLLLGAIKGVLKKAPPELQQSILFVSYDHDAAMTEAISQRIDLRVIWGGDETVSAIRAIPLAPTGRELVFPNRFSWMAIDAAAHRALNEEKKNDLAEKAFNDLYWFDQNGCASPHVIIWRGMPSVSFSDDFYARVATKVAQKDWGLDTGSSLKKQSQHFEAMADYAISRKKNFGNALTVFSLSNLDDLAAMRDRPCSGGTLFECFVNDLSELISVIERRDQTLTVFGFAQNEIEEFVREVGGRGFDRIVPVGEALAFDAVWDGYDLPLHFTRLVCAKV